MARISPLLDELIKAFCCLPGVGPKSAQRMVFDLLERNREPGLTLGTLINKAMLDIDHCGRCRTFSEGSLCQICENPSRSSETLCIVETPSDVFAIEQTASFKGYYFVLRGRLSPLDGIGPNEIGMDKLSERLTNENIQEIIIATNVTVEGDATAYYISNLAKEKNIKTTRIAQGVPRGGELDNIDERTLTHAFQERTAI